MAEPMAQVIPFPLDRIRRDPEPSTPAPAVAAALVHRAA